MVIGKPAPFVRAFVDAIDEVVREHSPGQGLSAIQRGWLAFCLTAILVTNSICWARFERASLGAYSLAALSWMFRHAKMPWEQLLVASVRVILRLYGLTCGSLVIDDTDNKRSKAATTLAHLYKLRDKDSGGYIWGQSLVFLVLVTPQITLPVGFAFYQPAPELSAWYKQDKVLKKQGVPPKQRPPKPPPNPHYPTKQDLALRLLKQVRAQLETHQREAVEDGSQEPNSIQQEELLRELEHVLVQQEDRLRQALSMNSFMRRELENADFRIPHTARRLARLRRDMREAGWRTPEIPEEMKPLITELPWQDELHFEYEANEDDHR
jgi:hypothetical protein